MSSFSVWKRKKMLDVTPFISGVYKFSVSGGSWIETLFETPPQKGEIDPRIIHDDPGFRYDIHKAQLVPISRDNMEMKVGNAVASPLTQVITDIVSMGAINLFQDIHGSLLELKKLQCLFLGIGSDILDVPEGEDHDMAGTVRIKVGADTESPVPVDLERFNFWVFTDNGTKDAIHPGFATPDVSHLIRNKEISFYDHMQMFSEMWYPDFTF